MPDQPDEDDYADMPLYEPAHVPAPDGTCETCLAPTWPCDVAVEQAEDDLDES
jgi:hypothetical protein